MPFMEWNSSYSIGIPEADEDHRYLIDLINELHEATIRDSSRETVDAAIDEAATMVAVLDELLAYASYHTSLEETYMQRLDYPDYDEHRKAHRMLADKVQAYRREFDDGKAILSMDIVRFLKDWLDSHLLDHDHRLGEFLNERGIVQLSEDGAAPQKGARQSSALTSADLLGVSV